MFKKLALSRTTISLFTLTIIVAAGCALVYIRYLRPLATNSGGDLQIQDFTYHYLLSGVGASTDHGSPYLASTRYARLKSLCEHELNAICNLSYDTQPVALSPTGFVALFLIGRLCGYNLSGALVAYTLLLTVSWGLWFWLGYVLYDRTKRRSIFAIPLLIQVALSLNSPFQQASIQGQPSLLVVSLVCLAILHPRHNNSLSVSVSLLVSTIKPIYFLPTLALFSAAPGPKKIVHGLIWSALFTVLAGVIFGMRTFLDYRAVLENYASGMSFIWYRNPLNIALYVPLSHPLLVGLGLAFLLTATSIWRQSTGLAACLYLVYVFFSPYVPAYELLLLLVPVVALCQLHVSSPSTEVS